MIIDLTKDRVEFRNDMEAIDDEMGSETTLIGQVKQYMLLDIAGDIQRGLMYPEFRNELIAKGKGALDGEGYFEYAREEFINDVLDTYLEKWVKELIEDTVVIKEEKK